jgi:hypothetical protein
MIEYEDYSSLITKNHKTTQNLSILNLESDEGGIHDVLLSSFFIENQEDFFGCNIDEFIAGLVELDQKHHISEMFNSGKIGDHDEIEDDNSDDEPYSSSIKVAVIKGSKRTIVLNIRDFVNAVDVNIRIMWNILDNLSNSEKTQESYSMQWNSDKDCPMGYLTDRFELLCPSSMLEFKNHKFNILKGE